MTRISFFYFVFSCIFHTDCRGGYFIHTLFCVVKTFFCSPLLFCISLLWVFFRVYLYSFMLGWKICFKKKRSLSENDSTCYHDKINFYFIFYSLNLFVNLLFLFKIYGISKLTIFRSTFIWHYGFYLYYSISYWIIS